MKVMLTVGQLKKMLLMYPNDMQITTEQNSPIIHLSNTSDTLIISAYKPIGICKRSVGNVYPSVVDGYDGFCPELDEDLYGIEFTNL
jgi:hypothetical protein